MLVHQLTVEVPHEPSDESVHFDQGEIAADASSRAVAERDKMFLDIADVLGRHTSISNDEAFRSPFIGIIAEDSLASVLCDWTHAESCSGRDKVACDRDAFFRTLSW